MNRLKLVFHINEPDKWQRVIMNINNFLNDVGQGNADIEVVANGEAVSAFKSNGQTNKMLVEQMQKLAEIGVNFVACQNALKAQSIAKESLPEFVTVVPAGITEIARKQTEGFAYIKP